MSCRLLMTWAEDKPTGIIRRIGAATVETIIMSRFPADQPKECATFAALHLIAGSAIVQWTVAKGLVLRGFYGDNAYHAYLPTLSGGVSCLLLRDGFCRQRHD
jgi:hypothetical protein